MRRILVLGAGHVARPAVRYLLEAGNIDVTVADMTTTHVEALLRGQDRGRMVRLRFEDSREANDLVASHDVVMSLLPAPLHPLVARLCLRHGRHLVTTSYVSEEMAAFDAEARDKGLLLLNEIGVDPGIDHMLAMRVIDAVRSRGGQVIGFRSYCGGLPAPEANNNPWGYKFSWSPRGVCQAGTRPARWRAGGGIIDVPGPDLFTCGSTMRVEGIGELEEYPNRDSLKYEAVYGLTAVEDMYRATLRYPGWRRTMKAVVDLGLLDERPLELPAGATMAGFLRLALGLPVPAAAAASSGVARGGAKGKDGELRAAAAQRAGLSPDSEPMARLAWLGLFNAQEPAPLAGSVTTRLDVLAARMAALMAYGPNERDMLVMKHAFIARYGDGRRERLTCTLIGFGEPGGDSAMSRLVGLPSAIAARLVAEGRLEAIGVQVPVGPAVYEPVLGELERLGVVAEDSCTLLSPGETWGNP